MDQDTLQALVRAAFPKGKQGLAVRESVSEIIQLLLQLDQQAFQYLFASRSNSVFATRSNSQRKAAAALARRAKHRVGEVLLQ